MTEEQNIAKEMADHDKHYWCLVRNLQRKKKNAGDLADLIGEGSTVAEAIWDKYAAMKTPSPAPEVMGTPEQDHELGDPLWPIYEKYAATRPKKLLTYSGWLKQVALKLEAPQPDPWVDVKVGLPDITKIRFQDDVQVTNGKRIWARPVFSMWKREVIPSDITHWRELPAPPEPRATEGK